MPSAGFENTTPAIERPQTHALDGAPVGIGTVFVYQTEKYRFFERNIRPIILNVPLIL